MDEKAEEHQGESHPKIIGTADEREVSTAKGATDIDQDTLTSQSERESLSKEITEPDQQFEPAQLLSKSSGREPDLTAEDPDVLKRKEQTQGVKSKQQKEEDSEPRGYSDSDSTTQLLHKDKDKTKFKIFVIGKTGTGKSSLCNKIIGRNAFTTGRSFKQVTTETQEEPTTLPGLNITVVDTPDISDKSETIQTDTVKRWRDSAKGYNYMVVLAVRCDARYSPAEYEVYRQIKQLWGNDLVKKLVVVFTFGDTREDPGLDMKKELEEVWPELKHVIKDANNRYVVFNNEPGNTDEKPVNELIEIMKHPEDRKLWKWVATGITVTLIGFIIWFMWVDM
ncbi:GTPase IMAP family member 9-like [Littorina saxatilis]|uniref:GTPase IMAP family member 9-like n=1 Tax=Littorina saxatilis TaxID=31220 RepID=UPI0038B4C7D9